MHVHVGACLRMCVQVWSGAPMASAEIAKHMTPTIFITITSAKKIMIMQLIV